MGHPSYMCPLPGIGRKKYRSLITSQNSYTNPELAHLYVKITLVSLLLRAASFTSWVTKAKYNIFHKHSGRKSAEQLTFPLKDEETQVCRVKSELSKVTLVNKQLKTWTTFSLLVYKVLFLRPPCPCRRAPCPGVGPAPKSDTAHQVLLMGHSLKDFHRFIGRKDNKSPTNSL